MGVLDILTLIFVTLKLCKVIDWPWVWVLSPIWIGITLFILIAAIMGGYHG